MAERTDTVRVALINDGSYPFRQTVASTWCHRIVRGLSDHRFDIVAVGGAAARVAAYASTSNTDALTVVAAVPPPRPRSRRTELARRRAATHAMVLLSRGMMSDSPLGRAMFRAGLRRLAALRDGRPPLDGVPAAGALFDAWRAGDRAEATGDAAPDATLARSALAEPNREDATRAAEIVVAALRAMAAPPTAADLNHAVDADMSALVALRDKWSAGTPFVITEHDTYLSSRLLASAADRPVARAVALRFLRALAQVAYQEAAWVVAPSERLRRWAIDHGADPARITVAGYGVDPHSCRPFRGEPDEPTVTFLGPRRDADTMLAAVNTLLAARLDVRLMIAGPAESPAEPAQTGVCFLGPVNHRRSVFATGQVLVVSGRARAARYAVVEAMMCGRPTIVLDDGEFEPVVGTAARVVPYGDAAKLAQVCATLLGSADRRREMSVAAARRARSLFALRTTTDSVRTAYAQAAWAPVAPNLAEVRGIDSPALVPIVDAPDPDRGTDPTAGGDLVVGGTPAAGHELAALVRFARAIAAAPLARAIGRMPRPRAIGGARFIAFVSRTGADEVNKPQANQTGAVADQTGEVIDARRRGSRSATR